MNLSQMFAQHKAGKARIIAILSKERSDLLPDVPDRYRTGPSQVEMTATRGFVAPAKCRSPRSWPSWMTCSSR